MNIYESLRLSQILTHLRHQIENILRKILGDSESKSVCVGSLTAGRPDIQCHRNLSLPISADIFESTYNLLRKFDCRDRFYGRHYDTTRERYYYNLVYNFTFENRSVFLTELDEEDNRLVADWLKEGSNSALNLRVCRLYNQSGQFCYPYSVPTKLDFQLVTIRVRHNTSRFFPYGYYTRDHSTPNGIDHTLSLTPPDEIPFFHQYFRVFYVRTSRNRQI